MEETYEKTKDIVMVHWIDSHGVKQDWSDEELRPLICISIGFFIEKIDYIIISPHYNHETNQSCGDMAIPKKAIKKMVYLIDRDKKIKNIKTAAK